MSKATRIGCGYQTPLAQVGSGGWSIVNDALHKRGNEDRGLHSTNSGTRCPWDLISPGSGEIAVPNNGIHGVHYVMFSYIWLFLHC